MAESDNLPNILIFMPDEMRADTISMDNHINPVMKTPHIDSVAKDGVIFTNCFTVNPVCGPSRCCTFTGQFVHSNGHRSLYQLLRPHEENLFNFLKKKGYEVIWIGRNDLFTKKAIKNSVTKRIRMKLPSGNLKELVKQVKLNPHKLKDKMRKSFYFGERTELQAEDIDKSIIESALEYLDSPPKKPFCLYLALNFPHPPYTVEEPYFSMYDRSNVPKPIPPKLDDKPEFMQIMQQRYGLNQLDEADFREIRATYYGMVSRVDDQFGQIIAKLKDIGEYDNTAIVFTADHGDYTGDYGLTEKWPNAFQDCLIHVPLVLRIPGLSPQKHLYEDLIQSIDIFATLMEVAQINTKYTHFSKNILPLLRGETDIHREEVFAEGGYNPREPQCFEIPIKNPNLPVVGIYYDKTRISEEKPSTVARSAMIRTQEWKLVIRDKGKEELYNLQEDPDELTNLIESKDYSQVQSRLKEKLLRWYLNSSDNAHWKKSRVL